MNERDAPTMFEVVVARIATCDLAYVWRVADGDQTGSRLVLKRSLVRDQNGQSMDIAEGAHLIVDVDPAQPTRITFARVIAQGR